MAGANDMVGGESLLIAVQWVEALLLGRVATAIAAISIAFIGYNMMAGRLAAKDALRIIAGCFILFGSPLIARGLIEAAQGSNEAAPPAFADDSPPLPTPRIPPDRSANPFDPYSSGRSRR